MIGIALFGAGVIGRVHAGNIAVHPMCALRWVVDQDLSRAEMLTGQHGGRAAETIDAALADPEVGAVIVASSTSAHYAHLMAAIAAGKAVLCEKPVADTLDDAKRCMQAAEDADVVVAVGFNRRFDANHRALHDRVFAHEIGKVELVHVVSRSQSPPPPPASVRFSGGMLREKGAHFYDLSAWITGAEPVEIFAAGDCLFDPGYAIYDDVDSAALTLRFETGALATFSFSRRTAYGYDELIEVFGAGGMLESRRQRAGGVSLYQRGHVIEDGLHAGWYERFSPTYAAELDAFVAEVGAPGAGRGVIASLHDGLRAQAVAEAAIQSIRDKKMIDIERSW